MVCCCEDIICAQHTGLLRAGRSAHKLTSTQRDHQDDHGIAPPRTHSALVMILGSICSFCCSAVLLATCDWEISTAWHVLRCCLLLLMLHLLLGALSTSRYVYICPCAQAEHVTLPFTLPESHGSLVPGGTSGAVSYRPAQKCCCASLLMSINTLGRAADLLRPPELGRRHTGVTTRSPGAVSYCCCGGPPTCCCFPGAASPAACC